MKKNFEEGQQVTVNAYWWPAMANRVGVVQRIDRTPAVGGGYWVRVHVMFDGEPFDFAPEELEPHA